MTNVDLKIPDHLLKISLLIPHILKTAKQGNTHAKTLLKPAEPHIPKCQTVK